MVLGDLVGSNINSVVVYGYLSISLEVQRLIMRYSVKSKGSEGCRRHVIDVVLSQTPIQPYDTYVRLSTGWNGVLEQLMACFHAIAMETSTQVWRQKEILHIYNDESSLGGIHRDTCGGRFQRQSWKNGRRSRRFGMSQIKTMNSRVKPEIIT